MDFKEDPRGPGGWSVGYVRGLGEVYHLNANRGRFCGLDLGWTGEAKRYTAAMLVTIDIPESVVAEAKARGISVETLVREKIEVAPDNGHEATDLAVSQIRPMTPAEAGAALREMRKRYTLGDTVTIRQLIEEGRRY